MFNLSIEIVYNIILSWYHVIIYFRIIGGLEMDIIIVTALTTITLFFSVYRDYFLGYPLILSFIMFSFLAYRKGYTFKEIMKMGYNGGSKVFTILKIFTLIGCITAIWMVSGTVPGIVYYGIKLMSPNYFVLYTFLICCLISFLLGTAFGTVSTVGVALMVIARGGGTNLNLITGAIIAGAYFGDRMSPMSSSANLLATLTDTDLYINIKTKFKTAIIPFILTVILYTIFSIAQPLNLAESTMSTDILNTFKINLWVLLPAVIILIMAAFKIDVKISMLFSIISALVIGFLLQDYSFIESIKYMIFGFHLEPGHPLEFILKGGGILSMVKVSLIVFISSSISGVLEGANMLESLEKFLLQNTSRYKIFISTLLTATVTAAFGCNQSISVVLTSHLMKKPYENNGLNNYDLASDIANTSIVIPALIPWNIAGLVPATTLMITGIKFIPYTFYLYLIPLINILYLKIIEMKKHKISLNN